MAQRPSDIVGMLRAHGIRPHTGLGQHFLHDANKIQQVVAAAGPSAGETVLEVGAGTGALTERLLAADASVIAVEVDPGLISILRERLGPDRPGFRLVEGDVLETKHRLSPEVARALGRRDRSFQLVANLPYQVASPLLATLATDWPGMHRAVVTIQKEVADRLMAPPGKKEYGPLGILVGAIYHVDPVAQVPPSCFWPRPKVGSTVVRLVRRSPPLTDDPSTLGRFLGELFARRRKQIGALVGRSTELPEGVRPTQRPEELTPEQLVALARRRE